MFLYKSTKGDNNLLELLTILFEVSFTNSVCTYLNSNDLFLNLLIAHVHACLVFDGTNVY